jgi:hypothetical protein
MPFAFPDSRSRLLADCSLSRKLACRTLAGRPIAAQYGGYALRRGPNSTTAPPALNGDEAMIVQRWMGFALAAAVLGAAPGQSAELPTQKGQTHKPKQAEPARACDIAGNPGVVMANGVCVRFSGYVSSQFTAGQLK